jgi:hypothetical protein
MASAPNGDSGVQLNTLAVYLLATAKAWEVLTLSGKAAIDQVLMKMPYSLAKSKH